MKKLLTGLAFVLVSTGAMAGTKSFNLSLTPDISVYGRSETIHGVTLSIWGENPQQSLAIGLVNGATEKSAGLSIGILNYADSYKGVQWGVVNYTSGNFSGWQGGPFFGLLVSAVNYTGGDMTGLQIGAVNYVGGDMAGLQVGVVNCVSRLSGLQLGIVNYAAAADAGVQIGLVNVIPPNPWFTGLPEQLAPAMILVNWRF